jgi:thiamine phosphate synthase YjbQ (UPF0047 family)
MGEHLARDVPDPVHLEGTVILQDNVDVLLKVQRMAKGMWSKMLMANHQDSRNIREKVLFTVRGFRG